MSSTTLVSTDRQEVDTHSCEEATPTTSVVGDSCASSQITTTTLESPQPDDEFWLDDGNLTLIAGDAEFRVYKGPIIANSPVFKSMLSLPQPDGSKSPAAACICNYQPAIVHLPDSPEDLRHLLRALVPGKTPQIAPEELSFHAVSACIRLGDKYDIDSVVQRSVAYLKKHFAESFDTWARIDPPRPPAFKAIHSIGVVNLARMTNTPSLLPTALMGCCMLDASELVNGFTREDGTLEKLSIEDIGRCFLGRANLMQANTLATLGLFNQTLSPGCTRCDVCASVFLKLIDELRNNERVVCTLEWFKYWSDYIDGRDDDRRICAPCYKMLQEREKQAHRDVWSKLPDLMGVTVEGWAADLVSVAAPETNQVVDGQT